MRGVKNWRKKMCMRSAGKCLHRPYGGCEHNIEWQTMKVDLYWPKRSRRLRGFGG